jgi:predicted O-methyltransferase YrrM
MRTSPEQADRFVADAVPPRQRVTDDQLDAIDGWFARIDRALFRILLLRSAALDGPGDLAELGVYQGQSAALIGAYRGPGETFTVVDLFESAGEDVPNAAELRESYQGLSQRSFEENYRRIHHDLPVVVRGPSASIVDHARHGTHRFVHIDASHLYEHVVKDIDAARTLLRPQGLVVFDDFQVAHALGVAAAAWGEVATNGLTPLLASPCKLYGTWGDPEPWHDTIRTWIRNEAWPWQTQWVAGHEVLRVWEPQRRLDRWLPPALAPRLRRAGRHVRHALGRHRADET